MDIVKANKYLESENEKYTEAFVEIEKSFWPSRDDGKKPNKMFRNKDFLVQVYRECPKYTRLTVNRTLLVDHGRWLDGITWDELQDIKSKIGYGHLDAVEVYPKDVDIVNVANMRHLVVLPKDHNLPFVWRK
jgi:hypothetical protein